MKEEQMKNILLLAVTSLIALSGCVVEETSGRGSEIVSCTPGALVTVACGADGIGSCEGDPILTVCDGAFVTEFQCGESGFDRLGRNDDFDFSVSRCPAVDVTCPASGLLSIRPTAFTGFPTCFWDAVE